MCCSRFVQ
jgi:hypothetical protein